MLKWWMYLIILVLFASPVFFWKYTEDPVHYENVKLESLEKIPPHSIVFVKLKGPFPPLWSVGILSYGVPLSFPLYDEEILKHNDTVVLAISSDSQMLYRVTQGDILPGDFPFSMVNAILIPKVPLYNVVALDHRMSRFPFEWDAWSWNTLEGKIFNTVPYPPLFNSPPWFSNRFLLAPEGAYNGLSPIDLFGFTNAYQFKNVRPLDMVWPGTSIFKSRKNPSRIIFAWKENMSVFTDDTLLKIPDAPPPWVDMKLTNVTRCKVVYYRVYTKTAPLFV